MKIQLEYVDNRILKSVRVNVLRDPVIFSGGRGVKAMLEELGG